MERRPRNYYCFILLLCLIIITPTDQSATGRRVGVILDLGSPIGSMVRNCMEIALQDLNSTTNLTLLFRNSSGNHVVLTAAKLARDLINKENVSAIVGPQSSEEARFVVELGVKYNVPVIWFSPSGPSLLPPRSRFFIHSNTTRSHCLQFEAIASMIEAYNWQCVIPIYEEPEFGNDLMPCLTYALQDMDTRVPTTCPILHNSSDSDIKEELNKVKDQHQCVFLAHMTVDLWSKLVRLAQEKGMMNEGYAWILTQGLSSVIDPGARRIKFEGSMDGVLGVMPSLAVRVETYEDYRTIWRKRNSFEGKLMSSEYGRKINLSLYGWWAYDTITTLAKAMERASLVNTNSDDESSRADLREAINDTYILGLSGNFSLKQGQLEPTGFRVYNVQDKKYKTIGYWRPETKLKLNHSVVVEWPGKKQERPPKLRVGVPTETHFTEFVDFHEDSDVSATGFSVDVFNNVIRALPFNLTVKFVPVNNIYQDTTTADDHSSYGQLLCDTKHMNDVDVMIGDITIVFNRTNCVDFTMPYLDSRVSMVQKVMSDSKNGWILLEPFDWRLWLILSVIFVGATVIVIILERTMKDDRKSKFNNFIHNPFLIYMSDILSLKRGTSKWVTMLVMFVLSIAVQVYTSNLTPILSERTTAKTSTWKDLQEIKRNNVTVGYQNQSWVKNLLINQIGLREDQLRPLNTKEEYEKELSKGAKKRGVDAIIDETPYLFLLLKVCPSCKMTGPIYKTGGFAFAFKKNSTLVSKFSAAILNVTQNVTLFSGMMNKTSLPVTIDKSSDEYGSDVKMRSLNIDDFGGLFLIVYSVLALFFIISIIQCEWLKNKLVSCCMEYYTRIFK